MGKKKSRESGRSSGRRKTSRINKQINRLVMKVKRWERYVEEIKAGKRSGPSSRWNTSGLKKHIDLLNNLV